MSNMSYCRYQNTSQDLQDCIDNLDSPEYEDEKLENLSRSERSAAEDMREQCETYIRLYDEAMEAEDDNMCHDQFKGETHRY